LTGTRRQTTKKGGVSVGPRETATSSNRGEIPIDAPEFLKERQRRSAARKKESTAQETRARGERAGVCVGGELTEGEREMQKG